MASIAIKPVSRSATPGSSVTFRVQVRDGARAVVGVRPCKEAGDYLAHFARGEREAPVGGEGEVLTVEVPRGAPMS